MNPDLLAAIVSLINSSMGPLLGSTPTAPKAWAEYAPAVGYPYAVVASPSETYDYQSAGSDGVIGMLVDGRMLVSFYATSITEARNLGRIATLELADVDVTFQLDHVLEFRPEAAATTPIFEEGVDGPTAFVRTITFHYREQFSQS